MISGIDAVEEVQILQQQEQRTDHRQHREEAGEQDEGEDRAGAVDRQARERVAGHRRDDDRDHGRPERDDRAVEQRREEMFLAEVVRVGFEAEVRGQQAGRPGFPARSRLSTRAKCAGSSRTGTARSRRRSARAGRSRSRVPAPSRAAGGEAAAAGRRSGRARARAPSSLRRSSGACDFGACAHLRSPAS